MNLGSLWFEHAPFSMLELLWRLARHTLKQQGEEFDDEYFYTRSAAAVSLNRLLLHTPGFHRWLAQHRDTNSA